MTSAFTVGGLLNTGAGGLTGAGGGLSSLVNNSDSFFGSAFLGTTAGVFFGGGLKLSPSLSSSESMNLTVFFFCTGALFTGAFGLITGLISSYFLDLNFMSSSESSSESPNNLVFFV